MAAVVFAEEQSFVEFLGIAYGGGNPSRSVPGDIVKFDGFFGGGEAVAADFEGVEDSGMSNVVSDDLIECPSVGVRDSAVGSLLR